MTENKPGENNYKNPDSLSADKQGVNPSSPGSQKAAKASRTSGGGWISFFIFVLALAALGLSGFIGQHVYFMAQDAVKASEYKLAMQASQQNIERLQEAMQLAQQQLNENEQQYQALLAEQEHLKHTIAGISGVNRVDWLLDELQHLTRLAHQRLILSHDAQGAIALLNAADQVVIEMRQSAALPIRQALASDVMNLRIAGEIDLEGAYIRLDTLSKKIEELNYKVPSYPAQGVFDDSDAVVTEENAIDANESYIEFQAGSAAEHILKKLQPYLFRSFRVDAEVKPLLSSSERQYLSRNMLLAIEQAQLALLRREGKSYLLSLEQSEKWVREYYDSSDPVTASVLATIEELKSYRLNPVLPDINATLDAVKVFAPQWQQEKLQEPQLRRSLSK